MGRVTYEDFLAEQRQGMPPVVKANLSGKTVLVTGANSGIGLETAKHFALMNPSRLILICRSTEKGEETLNLIKQATGFSKAEAWTLDLGDFGTVSAFADRAAKELDRIDIMILVENAAIFSGEQYVQTPDGWKSMFQVNAIAPAMHALLLLPKMLQTAKKHSTTPRLVMVSSNIHFWATITPEAADASNTLRYLSSAEYCASTDIEPRYGESKILNIMFVRALAQRLPTLSPTVIPVSLNPGFCLSGLRRNVTSQSKYAEQYHKMEQELAFTSEEGSRAIIYTAVGGEEDELRGGYVSCSKVAEVSDFILSEQGQKIQDKTWNEMIETLGSADERVRKVAAECLKV